MQSERIAPTKERIARSGGLYDPGNKSKHASRKKSERRAKVYDGDVIEALWSKRIILHRQYLAGDRLWADMYRAGMSPQITPRWEDRVDCDNSRMHALETRQNCWQAVEKARKSVGRQHWKVLELAVRENKSPIEIGKHLFDRKDRDQSRASGTDILRMALSALADHYGYSE